MKGLDILNIVEEKRLTLRLQSPGKGVHENSAIVLSISIVLTQEIVSIHREKEREREKERQVSISSHHSFVSGVASKVAKMQHTDLLIENLVEGILVHFL